MELSIRQQDGRLWNVNIMDQRHRPRRHQSTGKGAMHKREPNTKTYGHAQKREPVKVAETE